MATNRWFFSIGGRVCGATRIVALAGALAVVLPGIAHGAQSCDSSTFKGIYGLIAHGLIVDEPPIPSIFNGPVVRVGRAESDGNGNLTITQFSSYSGVPSLEPVSGTYTVSPDCVITFFVNAPPPVAFLVTFQGAISPDGSFVTFAQIDPGGATIRANSRRAASQCKFEDLKGSYDLEMSGTIMPSAVIPLPPPWGTISVGNDLIAGDFASAGKVTFKPPVGVDLLTGKPGTVLGKTNSSFNGHVAVESWSGTYQVNSDCTVTVNYSANAGPAGMIDFQWWGVLTDGGRDLRVIQMPLTLGPVYGDAYRASK
jgi:hypothetical protein